MEKEIDMVRALVVAGALMVGPVLADALYAQVGPAGGLPPQAAPQAEAQFEGELEVHYEDSATGSRLVHVLRIGNQRLEMVFEDGEHPGLPHGTPVRARGRLTNNTLSLRSGTDDVQALALASTTTFGEQRTLVMLINFQDNTSTPYTWSAAHATTFQTTSDFYRESSYGQTWLTGDVVGWFTIPMTSGTCDYYKIATLAEQAAADSGVNVSQYNRRVIAFPKISACGWWGLGNVGGSVTRSWVNGSFALQVLAHELGHNFGDYHSNSRPCSSSGCSTANYGDTHDIMGNKSTGHMNAFQKERLGWLNYGSSPPAEIVTSSGAYTIDTMSVPGSSSKALKVLKSVDGSGRRTWYYLETRAKSGFDGGVAPGVLLHTGSEATGDSSFLIDLAPTTTSWDGILDVGQFFTDTTAGVSFRTLAVGAAAATVEVTFAGDTAAPCTTRAPRVSLSPSALQVIDPGQSVAYSLTVINDDDAGCAVTEFGLAAAAPSGWTAFIDRPSVTVSPGTSGIAVLTVTPAAGATGTSTVTVSASRVGSTGPGGSTSASISVNTESGGDVSGPIEVSLSIASHRNGSHQLSAIVLSGGSPVSGAALTFRVTDPKGGVRTLSATSGSDGEGSVQVKPKGKDPKGTYQVQVTASSGGSTASDSVSFTY
jgi:hypothetical protein